MSKRVTIRVEDEKVIEMLEKEENMSNYVRAILRNEAYEGREWPGEDGVKNTHQAMVNLFGAENYHEIHEVTSALAAETNTPKKVMLNRIKRAVDAGYCKKIQGMQAVSVAARGVE